MTQLKWSDADEIGFQLSEKLPAVDPLSIRFSYLRKLVLDLPGFQGDSQASNEKVLEAIQMAWLGYYRENRPT